MRFTISNIPGILMIYPPKPTYRMTKQRQVILDVIRATKEHPSADEVYVLVRGKLPRISLGTVYRNLEILTEQGEIQRLELSGTVKRYDWNPNRHYHIRCMNCGRVDDAPVPPLDRIENELYGATVFTIIGHRLEFEGFCPECSKNLPIEDFSVTDLSHTT